MTTFIEVPAVPSGVNILTSTRKLRTRWADGELHDGWDKGYWPDYVTWTPECGIVPTTWPKCIRVVDCDGAPFVEVPKPASSPPDSPIAIPFWTTVAESCSTWGYLTVPQHVDRVERALRRDGPRQIARVMQTGLVNGAEQCVTIDGVVTRGISLLNVAQVASTPLGLTPAAGYDPSTITLVISGLLRAANDCGGAGEYTFHMPIELLPVLDHGGRVRKTGDRYYLFDEYPIIFDCGYDPALPPTVAPPGGPIPPAGPGEAWVYLTGPVVTAWSEWTHITGVSADGGLYAPADFESAQQNIIEVRAEKLAIAAFDPCCVFAGLVRYC